MNFDINYDLPTIITKRNAKSPLLQVWEFQKPLMATNVDEGEILLAREGKANLRDNMIRKINYKLFTANSLA